jgi:integrase
VTGKRGNGEGSIYQRADNGLWCANVSLPDGKRKYLYGKTRQDVASKLRAAQNSKESGTLVTGPRQTLGQFLDRWLLDTVKPTTRVRTWLSYSERVRLHIAPSLGKLALTSVTPQHLQHLYAAKLAAGLSSSTVNGIHVVLSRALKQALRWGLVAPNVCEAVEAPRPNHQKAEGLSAVEIAVFLESIRGDRYESLWITFLATGLRFGEAAALRWSDIDLEARMLTVRHTITRQGSKGFEFTDPKTSSSRRTIPLPAAAVEAMRAQRIAAKEARLLAGRRWQELDLVFPSGVGTPLRESHLIVDFHKTLERAGLPRRRIHDLRHTYATRLFALHNHPRAVQELMGHSRFQITMDTYTESVPAVLREAADSLDSVFERAV